MTTKTLTIIDAMEDPNLFGPFFDNDLTTWRRWMVFLKAVWGIPITSAFGRKLVRECAGRDAAKLNPEGYDVVLALCGRRSGKSRIAATCASFLGALAGLESRLAAGETGMVSVLSPTRKQGVIIRNYCRALYSSPMLNNEVIRERDQDSFALKNGNRVEILASDYRSVRGFSQLAVVIDEVAFFGLEHSSRVRTDTQIVQAVQPSLATTRGKLIAISSPYAPVGWAYETYKANWGNDNSQDTLVWNAPSRTMNPTLSQKVVDRAMASDRAAALSEWMARFREDIGVYVSQEMLEALVVKNRKETFPMPNTRYYAFADISGGRNDGSALAIAHRDGKKTILDCLVSAPAPNNPYQVIATMCAKLSEYGLSRVTGDCYSGEFVSKAFSDRGIIYEQAKKNASALYAEFLPVLVNAEIELLDWPRMIKQIASLERRTKAGGKDVIDHPAKGHDDLANVVAGVSYLCSAKKLIIGSVFRDSRPKLGVVPL